MQDDEDEDEDDDEEMAAEEMVAEEEDEEDEASEEDEEYETVSTIKASLCKYKSSKLPTSLVLFNFTRPIYISSLDISQDSILSLKTNRHMLPQGI